MTTFEDNFPELSKETNYLVSIEDIPLDERPNNIYANKSADVNYYVSEYGAYLIEDIEKHCLSKQRVREMLNRIANESEGEFGVKELMELGL